MIPMKDGTPWVSEVPDLSVYDWRGCRMLDKKCWSGKCFQCKCKLYKMGKPRAVPYKDCGNSYDEGWLDEICTERRDDEE